MAWPTEAGSIAGFVDPTMPDVIAPPPPSHWVDPSTFRNEYDFDARGRWRIFNAAGYRFYFTRGAPPQEGDPPFATNATLAHSPVDTFAAGEWYFAVSYFNGVIDSGFYPVGPNGERYLILRVSSGSELGNRPALPALCWIEQRPGGKVRVNAIYYQFDSLRADNWSLTYTVDGQIPGYDGGTPGTTVTQAMPSSGLAILQYDDIPAQAHGTTVWVRVQVKRGTLYSAR